MDKKKFYTTVRQRLGALDQGQVNGFEACLEALDGLPLSWIAYGLATAWHETAHTMAPVREAFKLSEKWREENLRYFPWYGRGYVQLTWEVNYKKADKECAEKGLIKPGELLAEKDLALRPDVAAYILRQGMVEGWFTGRGFKRYLPEKGVATREQYIQARRIINILDKADLIEDYAQVFEKSLRDGGLR